MAGTADLRLCHSLRRRWHELKAWRPAPLNLPAGQGRLRNGAYAFQWWVFGAFTIAMSIRIARDLRLREELAAADETENDLDRNPT